jgi:hypothetical protein
LSFRFDPATMCSSPDSAVPESACISGSLSAAFFNLVRAQKSLDLMFPLLQVSRHKAFGQHPSPCTTSICICFFRHN